MTFRHLSLIVLLIFSLALVATAQDQEASQAAPQASVQDSAGREKPDSTENSEYNKQENPPEPEAHGTRLRWKDIPGNVWHDQKAIFGSPLKINSDNIKLWLLFGSGAAAFLATDNKVRSDLPNSNSQLTVSRWASRMGADYSIYPLTALFYVYGKADNNPRARDTGRIAIQAMIDAEITVNILKTVTQRPRPETKDQSIGFFEGGDAFPSGHSIKSWALARVIAREFDESRVIPIAAYAAATTVSLARVAGRRHSPSDAFVGATMGFFIGDFVYRHHHAPSEKSKPLAWVAQRVNFQVGSPRDLSLNAVGRAPWEFGR